MATSLFGGGMSSNSQPTPFTMPSDWIDIPGITYTQGQYGPRASGTLGTDWQVPGNISRGQLDALVRGATPIYAQYSGDPRSGSTSITRPFQGASLRGPASGMGGFLRGPRGQLLDFGIGKGWYEDQSKWFKPKDVLKLGAMVGAGALGIGALGGALTGAAGAAGAAGGAGAGAASTMSPFGAVPAGAGATGGAAASSPFLAGAGGAVNAASPFGAAGLGASAAGTPFGMAAVGGGGASAAGGAALAGSGSGLVSGITSGLTSMGTPNLLGIGLAGGDAILRYMQGQKLEDIANQAANMANPMNQPQRKQYQQMLSDYSSGKTPLMNDPMMKAAWEEGMKQTNANLARMGMTGSGNAGQEYIKFANNFFNMNALPYLDWLSQMGGFNQGPGYAGNLYGQYASQATGAPSMALDSIGKMIRMMNGNPMLNTQSPYEGMFSNRMYT